MLPQEDNRPVEVVAVEEEEEAKTSWQRGERPHRAAAVAPATGAAQQPARQAHAATHQPAAAVYPTSWVSRTPSACKVVGWGSALRFRGHGGVAQIAAPAAATRVAAPDGAPPLSPSLEYFEVQCAAAAASGAGVGLAPQQPRLLVGFAPVGATSVEQGVFYDATAGVVVLDGAPLPPSARMLAQLTQQQSHRNHQQPTRPLPVPETTGAGVDANGRVFFTVDGKVACVPLAARVPRGTAAADDDHLTADGVEEARGAPVRADGGVGWVPSVVLLRRQGAAPQSSPNSSSHGSSLGDAGAGGRGAGGGADGADGGDGDGDGDGAPPADNDAVVSVVLCNHHRQPGHTSVLSPLRSVGPFAFRYANAPLAAATASATAAAAAAEDERAGAVFAAVSRWLACTGYSPLADRVVVPLGRLPMACARPHQHSAAAGAAAEPSLFSGAPCLAPFSWAAVFADGPEGPAAKQSREATVRVYKDVSYHIMHTGGFVRLCTARGRALWMAQNSTGHRSPDWKLHFSVELDDIPKAWDLLASLFVERGCEVGIKATYSHLLGGWSALQRGREITLYLFVHDAVYASPAAPGGDLAAAAGAALEHRRRNGDRSRACSRSPPREGGDGAGGSATDTDDADGAMSEGGEAEEAAAAAAEEEDDDDEEDIIPQDAEFRQQQQQEQCGFWLGREFEKSPEFFTSLVAAAEARLAAHGVRSRGCADGDLPLGTYASVRNEAFVLRPTSQLVHRGQQRAPSDAAAGTVHVPPAEVSRRQQEQRQPGAGEEAVATTATTDAVTAATAATAAWETRRAFIYPRNVDGWNAAQHQPVPVSIFDCRCAAAGVPVETERFRAWKSKRAGAGSPLPPPQRWVE